VGQVGNLLADWQSANDTTCYNQDTLKTNAKCHSPTRVAIAPVVSCYRVSQGPPHRPSRAPPESPPLLDNRIILLDRHTLRSSVS